MDSNQIRRLQQAVATYCWNADFIQFCQDAGLPPEGPLARQLWDDLQRINKALASPLALGPDPLLPRLLAPKVVWDAETILRQEG